MSVERMMGLCMFCSQDRDTINSICTALFTDISQLLGHQSCLDAMNGFAVKQAYIGNKYRVILG
jgi:hypothetical protein